MNSEQLEFSINWLESRIKELREHYKEEHKEDFDSKKMDKYVSRKLRIATRFLVCCNMAPAIEVLNLERFKY